jgi:uncharacterized protein YfaT (DUF1175 family)
MSSGHLKWVNYLCNHCRWWDIGLITTSTSVAWARANVATSQDGQIGTSGRFRQWLVVIARLEVPQSQVALWQPTTAAAQLYVGVVW